jgi:anthranilate phosphoribosyltransferase
VLGGEKGPLRDIALLNAAAALVISEHAPDLEAGLKAAAAAIDTGRTRQTLDALIRCSNA